MKMQLSRSLHIKLIFIVFSSIYNNYNLKAQLLTKFLLHIPKLEKYQSKPKYLFLIYKFY